MSLRTKIILLPVSIAILVALLMGGGMYYSGQKALRMIHDRELDTAEAWLRDAIDHTDRLALAQAETLAALPVVQQAVADRDDMALEHLLGPGFEHLKSVAGVRQLQFHLPPATSLIRIHKLSKRGDDLSGFRHTVVEANRTGTSLSGLERGRAGLGARGVAVVRHQGTPVGTVEVGLDLGMAFLERLSANTGNDYELYLMPDTTIATFDAADQTNYRLGATREHDPLLSSQDLGRLLEQEHLDRDIEINETQYAMRAVPLHDYSGNVTAVVTIAEPIQAYALIGRQLFNAAALAAVLALAMGALIGFVSGRNLAGQFLRIVDTTQRMASGDPALEITGTERTDEIGGINRALKQFHEKLKENARLAQALKDEEQVKQEQERVERERQARAAEAERRAEEEEAARQQELAAAEARAAQAEQAATEERMREQQAVVEVLATGLGALAGGDLTHEIDQKLPGEYETLRIDFNCAMQQLRETMQALKETAGAINIEVSSVAQASDDLSRRSERNAATLEETAAALDEITSSVRDASEGATEAKRLIEEANQNADEGNASVKRAVDAINRIEESSAGIARITSVIDEIAFQTNLLALNAGVEAARAGEAGRGFAVVASEVRALAQRSSDAAKEISQLIGTSGEEVKQGVHLVHQTGEALSHILVSVRNISDQVIRIANSSEEQATGLGEINAAVNQLDGTTQQNAAMFEETNAATAVLGGKTHELVSAIHQFRVEGDAPSGAKTDSGRQNTAA